MLNQTDLKNNTHLGKILSLTHLKWENIPQVCSEPGGKRIGTHFGLDSIVGPNSSWAPERGCLSWMGTCEPRGPWFPIDRPNGSGQKKAGTCRLRRKNQ